MANMTFYTPGEDTATAPWHVVSLCYAGALLQASHIAVMIGFTTPRSILRSATFPLQLLVASSVFGTSGFDHLGQWAKYFVIINAYLYCFHYLDLVLLRRFAFEANGPSRSFESSGKATSLAESKDKSSTDTPSGAGSVWGRLAFGISTTSSLRHPGTPYEVKNCPQHSDRDSSYAPSRGLYIVRALAIVLFGLALADFQTTLDGRNAGAPIPQALEVSFFSRLAEMTPNMVIERLVFAAVFWASVYASLQAWYGLACLCLVTLGFSEPRDCPPLFGSLSELYSVRKFWGSFWHQLLRNTFFNPAAYLTHDILCLPQTGLLQRYLKTFVTFALSGTAHYLADPARGVSLAESGAMRFFCMQTVGIMIEDGVQNVWKRISRHGENHSGETQVTSAPTGSKRNGYPAAWIRVVGFLWTWAFLAWTTPAWHYPKLVQLQQATVFERAFPWSLAEKVLGVETDLMRT